MEEKQINLIKDILMRDPDILNVFLFGSQLSGRPNRYSDVDIAVLFNEKIREGEYTDKQIELIERLRVVLNKEIDIVILNNSPLFLKYHILKEGRKICERPDRNEHNFEALAILQYFDFLPIKQKIENAILAKIKEA